MKIVVRHEAATKPDDNSPAGSVATPERACVWVLGDDGQYVGDPTFLEVGEIVGAELDTQVEEHEHAGGGIESVTAKPTATVGPVEQIA
jgi:hypothetical protein